MPHFTFPLSPDGPTVQGLVGLNDRDTRVLVQAGQPIPRPVPVRALLDTACDVTAVAGPVFQALQLIPVQSAKTQTAGGPLTVNLYPVSLSVFGPHGAGSPLLVRPTLLVTELAVTLPNVDALIGMDVLGECLFLLDGPGRQFILGF